jgi:hypothetical protein
MAISGTVNVFNVAFAHFLFVDPANDGTITTLYAGSWRNFGLVSFKVLLDFVNIRFSKILLCA